MPLYVKCVSCKYISQLTCFSLLYSYEVQEVALNCGMMLRECCRSEDLARIMLYADDFYNFFSYVEVSTFDIASDAFSTFKVGYIIGWWYKLFVFVSSFTFLRSNNLHCKARNFSYLDNLYNYLSKEWLQHTSISLKCNFNLFIYIMHTAMA